jgi:hypothetical protein
LPPWRRGGLIEVVSPNKLRAEVVEHYLEESRRLYNLPERAAGEPQRVLLVRGTNVARRELNREIRSARIAAGEIEEGAGTGTAGCSDGGASQHRGEGDRPRSGAEPGAGDLLQDQQARWELPYCSSGSFGSGPSLR